ncbi:MAG TPA: hypothetical protein VK123_04695 [Candidatus Limnocylindrales bacterium]|nr:hypothetical protein [Candidatus Limnocylindrales bacterium]
MHSFRGIVPFLPILLVLLLTLIQPSTATAQSESGAQSTFIDPSIAASGMGKAAIAVFWSDEPDDWANPSLLGYHRGVRYSYGRTQLVPDLANDVFFTTNRFTIGVGGIGVSLAGKPVEGLGGLRLDYGVSEATDVNGNVVGEFSSFEDTRQIGVGINVFQALESLLAATGGNAPDISRHVDLSLGHAWKTVVVDLAPASVTLDGLAGRGEATEKDRGALLRLTPFGARSRGAGATSSRVRVDLAGGFSQRNYDDTQISYIDVSQSDPIVEERMIGGAARLSLSLPGISGWARRVFTPEISLGAAWDQARYYEADGRLAHETINRTGQEVTLLGVVSLRHGYIDDKSGTIRDDTWGAGAALQYRGMFGARYDWARVPQSIYLKNVTRNGFSVFVDPYRIWHATHDEDSPKYY